MYPVFGRSACCFRMQTTWLVRSLILRTSWSSPRLSWVEVALCWGWTHKRRSLKTNLRRQPRMGESGNLHMKYVESALWILMAWCFSPRASVATLFFVSSVLPQSCNHIHLRYKIATVNAPVYIQLLRFYVEWRGSWHLFEKIST